MQRRGVARRVAAPRAALERLTGAVPAAVQLSVAATVAYAFAHLVLGHRTPVQAVTVTLTSLGFVRDARPRRVLETALGLTLGIALAEVLVAVAGTGVWQVGVVMLVALLVARLLGANPAVSVAVATVAALVLLLPAPPGGPWVRSVDGLVAGATALLATALLPRDPERAALRDARRLFDTCRAAFGDLVPALRHADLTRAEASLERLRTTQPLLDDWSVALESAIAVARISPLLRRHRTALAAQRRLLVSMDLAVRAVRSISRRAEALARTGIEEPVLAELVGAVGAVVDLLGRSLRDPALVPVARADLLLVAARLSPAAVVPGGTITESMVVVLVRPRVVDLLVATGLDEADARAALPAVG